MIVVKLGGAALKHSLSDPAIAEALAAVKEPMVVVHGGGPEINALCEKMGIKSEFLDGQRVTTPDVFSAVEMVLLKINSALVRGIESRGGNAVGLSGTSLGLFRCSEENPALGRVGRIEKMDPQILHMMLAKKWIPIIAPIGLFEVGSQHSGEGCNINADLAAAYVASQLQADKLIFFTDKDGILDAKGEVMRELELEELRRLCDGTTISGGMKVKARAILETLAAHPSCRVEVVNGIDSQVFAKALDGSTFGTTISSRS